MFASKGLWFQNSHLRIVGAEVRGLARAVVLSEYFVQAPLLRVSARGPCRDSKIERDASS